MKYTQESTKFNGTRNLAVTGEGLGVMGNGWNKQEKGVPKVALLRFTWFCSSLPRK